MTSGRRGFTLVELIVVTVLGSLVVLASMQVLITNRQAYTAQTATVSGQQTTRMAIEVLFAELREVSPSGGDILAMGPDSIRVRLMRKFSAVCLRDWETSPVRPRYRVARYLERPINDTMLVQDGTNRFAVGDSVFVYADNNVNIDSDDVWIPAEITAVDATVICPLTGDSAIALSFNGQASEFTDDSVGLGAPVRSYQEYTFSTTTMNGDVYLARRRGGGDYVPIAGPLAQSDGLAFVYRDSLGVTTSDEDEVAQIEVTVRTGSKVMNSLGKLVSDSVQVWIYTRN